MRRPLPSGPVRLLFPPTGPGADVGADPVALYAADRRPPPPGRPWVMMNMVTSLDGATTIDGRSAGLGGPADRAVFAAVRGVADVILVGAGTVRAEGYGPPRSTPAQRARRRANGQTAVARLALCSASLTLDPGSPLFVDAEERPIVFTAATAPTERRDALATVAEVVVAGERRVDVARMLSVLFSTGARVVLVEGGPSLNGQLVAADLLDELCLTVSPQLLAGRSDRIAVGDAPARPVGLALDRLLEADGLLLARYVRPDTRETPAPRPPA